MRDAPAVAVAAVTGVKGIPMLNKVKITTRFSLSPR